MRALALALTITCACAGGIVEDTVPDAGVAPTDDAATGPDPSDATCDVYVAGAGVDRGKVGGGGGGKTPFGCDDGFGQRIIGIAMQMSNQNTVFGGRSAQGIAIECASVSVDRDGTSHLGGVTTKQISGLGTFGWSPSTLTPVTRCPPGSVLTGLLAHTGADGNRFLNVTMTCSDLDVTGRVGATHTLKVAGSLTDTAGPSQVKCAAGEIVSGLGAFTGAGLDAVSLFCAAPTCR